MFIGKVSRKIFQTKKSILEFCTLNVSKKLIFLALNFKTKSFLVSLEKKPNWIEKAIIRNKKNEAKIFLRHIDKFKKKKNRYSSYDFF